MRRVLEGRNSELLPLCPDTGPALLGTGSLRGFYKPGFDRQPGRRVSLCSDEGICVHRGLRSGRRLVCGACKEQGELTPEGSRG